jgi:hypothetical protein
MDEDTDWVTCLSLLERLPQSAQLPIPSDKQNW